jgi:hypothetical protein
VADDVLYGMYGSFQGPVQVNLVVHQIGELLGIFFVPKNPHQKMK